MSLTNAQLFRAARRVAVKDGFVHGWPSCASANYGDGPVWGTYRLPAAPWIHTMDVPQSQLQTRPNADSDQIGNLEWAAHRWATAHGYMAALPTYEQAYRGSAVGEVIGLVLFDSSAPITFFDVLAYNLHAASPIEADGMCADPKATWNAVNLWAYYHGLPAGFPDFETGDHGGGTVYGTFLVENASHIQFRDVPQYELEESLEPIIRPFAESGASV